MGTVALLVSMYLVWDYQSHRSQFLAELQDSAGIFSKVISNGLIGVEMSGRHPELLQASIEQFGKDPSIAGIFLLDSRGTVRFSSQPALNGRNLSLMSDGCRECHQAEGRKPGSVFIKQSGVEILRNVVAVANRRECYPCHSSAGALLGFLIVDLDARGVTGMLAAVRNEMLVKSTLTVLALLSALGMLMHRLVITRLKRLTAITGVLVEAREETVPRAPEGADEIGQLGASFNRMVASLAHHRREMAAKEESRRLLIEKIVEVQEEERKRISRELHDHVGQSLSAILLECQAGVPDALHADRRDPALMERIRCLIDEVHQLAWEMRPSVLDDYGLDSALQTIVDDTAKHHGIPIDYQSNPTTVVERLPPCVEVVLYRVAQEALANVVRHSEADCASVVLLRRTNNVMLLVEDNGCGFDLQQPQNDHKGLGLIGMRERVSLCGGSCTIESALNCGTTVRVQIPLPEVCH